MSDPTSLPLSAIKVGKRHRRDLGDVAALALSIRQVGLLQPVAVRPDGLLVAGRRRLEAVKLLGEDRIDVHVVRGVDEQLRLLQAERDENVCRQPFTPSEAVSIGMALEKLLRAEAKRRQATSTGGKDPKRKPASGNLPEPDKGQTRDQVGEAVGMSGRTYEQARFVVGAAKKDPALRPVVEEMDRTGNVHGAYRRVKRKQADDAKNALPPPPDNGGERWSVERADCIAWFRAQPPDSINLVLGSPDYADGPRLYLENGHDLGIAKPVEQWVPWMVQVYQAALRCCTGLVAFVVAGRTQDYAYNAAPERLTAALIAAGICVRQPIYIHRVGIPGSGGPDWLRADVEVAICATRGGQLPWSDNTAMGHPPVYGPGGDPSHRLRDGSRVNGTGHATMEDRNNLGPHRARRQAGRVYEPPEVANPGNVLHVAVGGGAMGDRLCHENEAPFGEDLAEFFIRTWCQSGGTVCDPVCGSGTSGAVAVRLGRRFLGCDIRESQVELTRRRLAGVPAAAGGP
jgi:ParB family chromosome partitioning protein